MREIDPPSRGLDKVDKVDTKTPKMPAWAGKFLKAYAANGVVKSACAVANVSREIHYRQLRNNPRYAAAFQEIEEEIGQMLEDLAVERVRDGNRKLVLFQGQPVQVNGEFLYQTEFDSHLHVVLLKRFKKQQYAERASLDVTADISLAEKLTEARNRMVVMRREDPSGTEG